MSEDKDTTPPEFCLESQPPSREEERKAKHAAYMRAYNARPEPKAKKRAADKAYQAKPEPKAKRAAYMRDYMAKPEVKAQYLASTKAYQATPKGKAALKAQWTQTRIQGSAHKRTASAEVQPDDRARNAMIANQGNQCLCCKTAFGMLKGCRPNIDHCHATGRVRGIICNKCNLLLGHADDSPEVLRMCAVYLESH